MGFRESGWLLPFSKFEMKNAKEKKEREKKK
jgi:hypothetical protein